MEIFLPGHPDDRPTERRINTVPADTDGRITRGGGRQMARGQALAGCEGCSAAAGWGQKKYCALFFYFRSPSHLSPFLPLPSPSPTPSQRRCRKPRQRQPKYHLSHSFFAPSFSHCRHHEVYRCPLSIRPPRFCPVLRTWAFTVHTERHFNKKVLTYF